MNDDGQYSFCNKLSNALIPYSNFSLDSNLEYNDLNDGLIPFLYPLFRDTLTLI